MTKLVHSSIWRIFLLAALISCLVLPASAAEAEGASVYCFGQDDFTGEDTLTGIFVKSVPDQDIGTVCYGKRVICAGDVLPAEALDALTLSTRCQQDAVAQLTYLPLYDSGVGTATNLRINIRSGKAGIPVAKDLKLETYKNIANDGQLKASGGKELTFAIDTEPKLGKVELKENGSFVYTPDQNKVGKDSFTYTVSDKDGNTSSPATVSITILQPSSKTTYADMEGDMDAFEALWLRESGVFSGGTVGGKPCFRPEETVSREEFLIMAMRLMDMAPMEEAVSSGFVDEQDASAWARPYLATAMRHGIVSGMPSEDGLVFRPQEPISYAAASVILQNMLELPMTDAAAVSVELDAIHAPAWAEDAITVMASYELPIALEDSTAEMTRGAAAKLLYSVSLLN